MTDDRWVVTVTRSRFGEWARVRNAGTIMNGDDALVWAWTRRGLRRKVARCVRRAERKAERQFWSLSDFLEARRD